jgi:hypothetical protein
LQRFKIDPQVAGQSCGLRLYPLIPLKAAKSPQNNRGVSDWVGFVAIIFYVAIPIIAEDEKLWVGIKS